MYPFIPERIVWIGLVIKLGRDIPFKEPLGRTRSNQFDGHRFENSNGSLAQRMIDSLRSAQKKEEIEEVWQSAALLVVRKGWGYGGLNDRFRDIRVTIMSNRLRNFNVSTIFIKRPFPDLMKKITFSIDLPSSMLISNW